MLFSEDLLDSKDLALLACSAGGEISLIFTMAIVKLIRSLEFDDMFYYCRRNIS